MELKKLIGSQAMLGIFALIINIALFGGAVWLVVMILKWTGVIA